MYQNSSPPKDLEGLVAFLEYELAKIAEGINDVPKYTQEQFEDKDSLVNKANKGEGRQVWDATHKRPVWATGNAPTDFWVKGDGTIAYSPA